MLSADEIEALALGSNWVAEHADDRLALAARDAIAKLAAILPRDIADALGSFSFLLNISIRYIAAPPICLGD